MMNKYLDILNKLEEKPPPERDDHIVLVDSLNTFIRNFTTLKALTPGGHHIGGLLGFLRSLGYLVRTLEPTRLICVFDGRGSSMNRKNMDSNYKANRENMRVTNWGMFDSRAEEKESMSAQIFRLQDYLEVLPVGLMIYDKVEADDVISFIAQEKAKTGSKVTIVSSDKDFLQIVNSSISVYAPIKRKLIDINNIQEYLGMHPSNYLVAKALLGDHSDNLVGVKGVGQKGLLKFFPELVDVPGKDLDYVYNICESSLKSRKIFAKIIYDWDKVEMNYKLMNIQDPRLIDDEKNTIMNDLEDQVYELHTGTFLRYMEQDKIEGITNNTEAWLETFRPLTLPR